MLTLPSRLGVKTRIFHLGDYRRATVGEGGQVPQDYFYPNASPASVILRQKILKKCREDIYAWLNHENGQVAIYDAVNPTASGRRSLAKEFAKHDVQVSLPREMENQVADFVRQTLFIESYVDDEEILKENARNVKISSPDVSKPTCSTSARCMANNADQFHGMDPDEAASHYLQRIQTKIPVFETMEEESELNYVKMTNAGQRFFYNNVSFNYLSHRIVFYLTNLHVKFRTTFFVRAGNATEEDSFKADAPLCEEGRAYATKVCETLVAHREEERRERIARSGVDVPLRPLTVWTSTRLRTIETADPFKEKGFKVRQRSQMSQINPGVCERMSERVIRATWPDEVIKHEFDPYHHRYPRAEVGMLEFRGKYIAYHVAFSRTTT
jgi:6-phosphofructo-2-kinase/fructose-2,6-biphosphatase 4